MKPSKTVFAFMFVALSVIALVLTGAAAPKIVYVAPDGTGDGTSWENAMGSISNAYASAAAFAENNCDSGEVWLKRGIYCWGTKTADKDICIEMQPHVTVRGGFAGTETSADQARPDMNNSVISGDFGNNAYWCPNGTAPAVADRLSIWRMEGDNPVLNEPDLLPGTNYVSVVKANGDCQNGFIADKEVTDCEFDGVVFSAFQVKSVWIKTASTDIRIKRCTVVGGDVSQAVAAGSAAAFFVADTPLTVSDCNFICCWNAAYICFETVFGHTLFSNCVFRKCMNAGVTVAQKGPAGLESADDSSVTLSHCTFEKGHSWNGTPALAVSVTKAMCAMKVEDCVFLDNVIVGTKTSSLVSGSSGLIMSGGASGSTYIPQTIERCRFVGNRMTAGTGYRSTCLYLGGLGRVNCVRDCYFASNTVCHAASEAASGSAAAIIMKSTNQRLMIVNTTFEDNVATAQNEGTFAGIVVCPDGGVKVGVVNSVFRRSVLASAAGAYVADIFALDERNATVVCLGNTIFANDADDYGFWGCQTSPTAIVPSVFGVAVPDLAKVDTSAFSGDISSITAKDPRLGDTKTGVNGAIACGVGCGSAYAKNGYPVCRSSDGDYFLVHTKENANVQWRAFPTDVKCKDDVAESTYGVTSASPLVPDAFGAVRTEKRVAYGPLNAPVSGLMLLLR